MLFLMGATADGRKELIALSIAVARVNKAGTSRNLQSHHFFVPRRTGMVTHQSHDLAIHQKKPHSFALLRSKAEAGNLESPELELIVELDRPYLFAHEADAHLSYAQATHPRPHPHHHQGDQRLSAIR